MFAEQAYLHKSKINYFRFGILNHIKFMLLTSMQISVRNNDDNPFFFSNKISKSFLVLRFN